MPTPTFQVFDLPPLAVSKRQLVNDAIQAARAAGVPARIFLKLIFHESSFDPGKVSPRGAVGIAQIMPTTAKALGLSEEDLRGTDRGSVMKQLRAGARYLREQVDRFGGDPRHPMVMTAALAAYNAGPTRVSKRGVNQVLFDYPETRNYVYNIQGKQQTDRALEMFRRATNKHPELGVSTLEFTEAPIYDVDEATGEWRLRGSDDENMPPVPPGTPLPGAIEAGGLPSRGDSTQGAAFDPGKPAHMEGVAPETTTVEARAPFARPQVGSGVDTRGMLQEAARILAQDFGKEPPRGEPSFAGGIAAAILAGTDPEGYSQVVRPTMEANAQRREREFQLSQAAHAQSVAQAQSLAGTATALEDQQRDQAAAVDELDIGLEALPELLDGAQQMASDLFAQAEGADPNDPLAQTRGRLARQLQGQIDFAEKFAQGLSAGDPSTFNQHTVQTFRNLVKDLNSTISQVSGVAASTEGEEYSQAGAANLAILKDLMKAQSAPVQLNEQQSRSFAELPEILRLSNDAYKTLRDNPNLPGGPLAGSTPWRTAIKYSFGLVDDSEISDFAAQIGGLGNAFLSLKSGAAISDGEYERLVASIPVITDTVGTVRTKMKYITRFFASKAAADKVLTRMPDEMYQQVLGLGGDREYIPKSLEGIILAPVGKRTFGGELDAVRGAVLGSGVKAPTLGSLPDALKTFFPEGSGTMGYIPDPNEDEDFE